MAAPTHHLRLAGDDDRDAILALIAATFPNNPKGRGPIFDWQYGDNPFAAPRSWVVEDDGAIVGHYAAIALPAVLDGKRVVIGQGIDAAIAASHRGGGLFQHLARAVYDDAGAAGMPLTYCLPNRNSLGGAVRAGMRPLGAARVLVAPLDPAWMAARFKLPLPVARAVRRGFRVAAGGRSGVIGAPPPDIDGLWSSVAGRAGDGLARDGAWWAWRYVARPERAYLFAEARPAGRLTAAAVGLVREDLGGRFLCVLELLAEDAASARAVLGDLVGAADDAVGVAATVLPGTWPHRVARSAGLLPLPHRFEPQPMHVGMVDNTGTRGAGLARMRWSLVWGDLDHI